MSELKHTPGPWCVQLYDDLDDAHEHQCFQWCHAWDHPAFRNPLKGQRPAKVWQWRADPVRGDGYSGLPGSIEVGEFNARLIAAAPAMKDLLKRLLAIQQPTSGMDCIGMAEEVALLQSNIHHLMEQIEGRVPGLLVSEL